MAVAKDGTAKKGSGGFTQSVATPATVSTAGTDRLLLASVTTTQGGSPVTGMGVTGGGLTWTRIVQSNAESDTRSEIWFAWAAAQLTNQTITATWTGNSDGAIMVQAWSGSTDYAGLTAGVDYATASAVGTGSTDDSSTNITTLKAGSWAVGATAFRGGLVFGTITNVSHLATAAESGPSLHAFDERDSAPLAVGTYAIGAKNDTAGFIWTNALAEVVEPSATHRPRSATGGGAYII